MTDLQILELIRSGRNDKALAVLYQHLPAIRRMIRHYGGGREDAEDIFQEALIIFCRKAKEPAFTLSSGVFPWLYSVCRFLWKDELRKRNRVLTTGDEPEDVPSSGVTDAIADEYRYRLAEQIITTLADRCKELLLLFYQAEMKLKDIAAKMGYGSEQSAKNQKYKCLEHAREQYRKQQFSQPL